MKYQLLFSSRCKKEISKLDSSTKRLLKGWISNHLLNTDSPRSTGKALTGNKNGYWRYRVGNYRLIVEIHDKELLVLAITFGHRSEVYK